MRKKNEKKENKFAKKIILLVGSFLISLFILGFAICAPVSPDSVNVVSNETMVSGGAHTVNISGGYIATLNISATVQNPHWKAFVGNVTGSFTLDDASGATIYDWTLSSITGRIYATRNSSAVSWSTINCSSAANLTSEGNLMNHTNPSDSINVTFNTSAGATHDPFYVGSVYIGQSSCPTLNTYNNTGKQDSVFEEIALWDRYSIIYATILEENVVGFDGNQYDFQMLVPENGISAATATPYYIYVEIS
jgi:hypothetical protein